MRKMLNLNFVSMRSTLLDFHRINPKFLYNNQIKNISFQVPVFLQIFAIFSKSQVIGCFNTLPMCSNFCNKCHKKKGKHNCNSGDDYIHLRQVNLIT